MQHEPTMPSAPTTETQAVLSMIERVALSPDADLAKLEKMLDMQERILNRNAKQEFASALADLQAELPEVEKLAKGHGTITYAKFEHILAAIRPHLIAHGFAITHRCNNASGQVSVTAVLSHRGGHSEETSITLPADTSGSKNAVQAIGSSMEYGRRYTMNALLGIATKSADDDGASAANPGLAAAITEINKADSMEVLRRCYADAYRRYSDVNSRKSITAAYDYKKGELSNV